MTRKNLAILLALLLLLTTLSGCAGQGAGDSSVPSAPASQSGNTGTSVEGSFPEGPVVTVDLSTAGWTSGNWFIETETGYYSAYSNQLRYADKSDLSNWVVVCNKPDCKHKDEDEADCTACNAVVFLEGDRIYFTDERTADGTGVMLYSMARDGSDLRMEHPIAGAEKTSGGCSISRRAAGNMLCLGFSEMQNDGSTKNRVIRVTSSGSEIMLETEAEEYNGAVTFLARYFATDAVMIDALVYPGSDGEEFHNCRMTATEWEDLSKVDEVYNAEHGFLHGDYLYRYVPNDGYYITQLSTGASKRQMDAQLKDGRAYRLTDQWAVETNTGYDPAPETPELRIFNGSEWKSVQIPEEADNMFFRPIALTTEHMFFMAEYVTDEIFDLRCYCVSLKDETYTMQRMRFTEKA